MSRRRKEWRFIYVDESDIEIEGKRHVIVGALSPQSPFTMLFSFLRGLSDMHQVNIEDAKTHLTDLIDAAVNGEEVVIAKDDQHIVKLVPIARTKPRPQFGSAKGLIKMSDDFDAPLEDFAEYEK